MINLVQHKAVITATLSVMLFLSSAMVRAQESWKPEVGSMKLTARQVDMECGFHCIELQVYNNSESQAVVLDASNAECENQHATLPQQIFCAADQAEQDKGRKQRALASMATAGLGSMLVAEHEEKHNGPLAWLGRETKDRQIRGRIFERRVIGPGDSTAGLIYLKDRPPDVATLRIPAMFVSQYGQSNQILTVPLSGTTIDRQASDTTSDTNNRLKD